MSLAPAMHRVLFEMVGRGAPAPALTPAEWRDLLALADRTQLTLYLRGTPGLPQWLVEEIEVRHAKNAERRRRLLAAYVEAARTLAAAGIDFVLLKGFTHEAGLGGSNLARVQYDLDILTQPGDVARAGMALECLGYAPHGEQSLSEEHTRPLVRPSDWSWREDYYDPEMPIPVELHGSVWSAERDRIHPPGMEEFWRRRCFIEAAGLRIPAFAEVDRLAFAALHALRHILRNDTRPAHVLELGRFLVALGNDACFWNQWRAMHPPQLRALQSIAFRFAHEWFGCALPEAIAEAWIKQPQPVTAWFRDFAWSPLGMNKDTVWLHLALIANRWDRVRVFSNRMAPLRRPHEKFLTRLRYHTGALAPVLANGVRWWWRCTAASTASEISDWKRRSV
jgi:hypothetical protein